MWTRYLVILLLLAPSVAQAQTVYIRRASANCATSLPTPVAVWEMEEASGNTRVDSQGADDDLLEVRDGIANSVSGVVGNAIDFESTNEDYLGRPSTTRLQATDNWTIAFHVKFETLSANQWLVNKWNNVTSADREYVIRYNNTSGEIDFIWYLSGGGSDVRIGHSATLSTGTWYSIIAWQNGTANKINLSINGSVETTTGATSFNASTDSLRVGARDAGGAGITDYADGLVDQMFVWQDTLSSANRDCLDAGVDYEDL